MAALTKKIKPPRSIDILRPNRTHDTKKEATSAAKYKEEVNKEAEDFSVIAMAILEDERLGEAEVEIAVLFCFNDRGFSFASTQTQFADLQLLVFCFASTLPPSVRDGVANEVQWVLLKI
ncbi:hypothetical protein QYF36_014267 [Acer negundo]|nr:hypothetical protein QYF36_014267 [Acer negundo]